MAIMTLKTKDYLYSDKDFYTHISKDAKVERHSHEFFEFTYILEGERMMQYDNAAKRLVVGDFFLMRPGDVHEYLGISTLKGIHRDIIFSKTLFENVAKFLSPELYSRLLKERPYPKTRITMETMNHIEQMITQAKVIRKDDVFAYSYGISILISLLTGFLDGFQRNTSFYPSWIKDIINDFNEPMSFPYSTNNILKKFYFDHSYLRKTFKKYVGVGMCEYRLNVRLSYAQTLLSSSDYSIKKISVLCGFNNATYFYRAYKKKYGSTPRKNLSKEANDRKNI